MSSDQIDLSRVLNGDYSQLEGMNEAAKQRLIAFAKTSGNGELVKKVDGE